MIAADKVEGSVVPAPALRGSADLVCERSGIATYRLLTGCNPVEAVIADDRDFDRHVLASILAAAAMEGEAIAERVGVAADELAELVSQYFPVAGNKLAAWCAPAGLAEDDEVGMVRDLLLAQRSSDGDIGRWLAAMIARRAMEPNHL
jgi:nitrogen fixation protein NifQ